MHDYFLWGCVRVKRKERESLIERQKLNYLKDLRIARF